MNDTSTIPLMDPAATLVVDLVNRYPEVFAVPGGGCIDIAAHISYDPNVTPSEITMEAARIVLSNGDGLTITHTVHPQHGHDDF